MGVVLLVLGLFSGFILIVLLAVWEYRCNRRSGRPTLGDVGTAVEFAKYQADIEQRKQQMKSEYDFLTGKPRR